MPNKPWKIEINEDTPEDELELCALSADRTSDPNTQKVASQAKVELKRRDRKYERDQWTQRFNAESEERVKAQKFQEGQTNKQLEIASKHLRVTWIATAAAAFSAIAAVTLVYLTAAN